ncbi:glycosyl transferase family protein [Mycolicibacterium conceptionense]|uniref:Glycosyl transferase family protein n=1 Tax=Mycolicibacterium conceptionense TaxID=451644 RepID=A0A0U1CX46_9MYCO|nr:glycosyl transferase family protein [Mycolicibacterium conceptionense]
MRPADVDELTAVLGELLDSPSERRKLGAAGRQRALDVFSWESVAAQTVAVYEMARERVGARTRGAGEGKVTSC